MKNGLSALIVGSLITLFTFGCAKPNQTPQLHNLNNFKTSRWFALITPDAVATIQVFNQNNQPIKDAQILIGHELGNPFQNNLITTDSNGLATAKGWTTKAHITIDVPGYIRQTLLDQTPGTLQIKINESYKNPRPEVKGQVTGLPVVDKDKFIDFGLVIPTITKADLLNFDLGSVISPYTDTISIVGQEADLPSNVSLPTQKESYFLPITLSKPEYRVYATTYGPKTYFALSGKFPFKAVISELKDGKKFYEILNLFSFTTGGLREVTVTGPSMTLNIPGVEMKFDSQVAIKGSAIQADEVVMALTMNDLSGRFVPSDVKRLETNQTLNLNILKGKPTYVVSLLKKQADFDSALAVGPESDRLSASIIAYKTNMQTSLLPLIASPVISQSAGSYKIQVPTGSNIGVDAETINPIAISAAVSELSEIQNGATKITVLNRKWEIMGNSWPVEIQLPVWPTEATASTKRRFEVNLIGSNSVSHVDLGDDLIKAATHVTHSAAEF